MIVKENIFITIEGGEGSGKTTQSQLLSEYLEKKGFEVLLTREPGGSVLAENIRDIILDPKSDIVPLSELFLFEAARAQHIEKLINPALKMGKIVVCDRFTDATIAYQGYGRKLNLKLINKLNLIASIGLKPALTLYLDVIPFNGLSKAKKLNGGAYGYDGDRIERKSIRFHEDVRIGYLEQAKKYSKRIKVVKTQETAEKTHILIKDIVDRIL
ncbi:MAG: dTMP kinase [Endomicrobiia bacterium]|nr:MAG: dTMP kinase [Endomicrobiia bacterium]